ncbi:2-succinyl-6-hydroxy-2,4-cyclohexadiene-1-carboxylate synthase [hydrothermal vent metagenome]|uniref:2-succinyl-6-hydroxy-2,4-cyclohexadiene-1-carboxylate synthase n=1 Tax=hydrothermal vent metagenome TaxID=652676 RepID=A0A3B1CK22_9ZZZZ
MEIKINGITVNIVSQSSEIPNSKIPIVFLHGFTGSANDWKYSMQNVNDNYFPVAIDLPGHGDTEISENIVDYTSNAINNIILSVIEKLQIPQVVLLGYSMGGRAALSFASQHSSKITALILESSTAGIENADEREERLMNDTELAEKIEKNGIEDFIKQWMELPLFESLKSLSEEEYKNIIKRKIANNKKGLANSLRGFSTGKMKSLWDDLGELNFPVLLITGSLDKKYELIATRMDPLFQQSGHKIVKNAGHNVHLEKPKEFIKLVNNFLEKL